MEKHIKTAAKVAGILACTILLLWLGVSLYIQSNSKKFLTSITSQLNENLNGTVVIDSMEPELIRGFPGISVSLKNVQLRDDLYQNHQHSLLKAESVYLAVDAFSLLSGPPKIKKISVEEGEIYLFTDSAGYSNTSMFKTTRSKADTTRNRGKIASIELENIRLIYNNISKNKYINLHVRSSSGTFNNYRKGWRVTLNLNALVNRLEFNTRKGSFLKNKNLQIAGIALKYDNKTNQLSIPVQPVTIQGNSFKIGGSFFFAKNNSDFSLTVKANDILFKDASALLLPHITKKLSEYNLQDPINAQATITGELKGTNKKPLILATWQVRNNTLTVGDEIIKDCSFTGSFTNEVIASRGRTDTNSNVTFDNMRGKWHDIDFKSPKVRIVNLRRPVIEGKFMSDFPLRKLNAISGGETFFFDGGTAKLNLDYKASLIKTADTKPAFVSGTIRISKAAATYKPRNIKFNQISLLLNFREHDLLVKNMTVSSGKTQLFMQGSLRNFLNFYYTDPEKIILDWHITSPQINLGEFLVFLGKRKSGVKTSRSSASRKSASVRLFQQLDDVLDQASAHLLVKVDKLIYKKFVASNVTSDITMKQSGININGVSLSHGGGNLKISGNVDQSGTENKIFTATRITNVDVRKLFTAFENFGQDAITDQNLRGVFSGTTKMSAIMNSKGEFVPRSFHGTVSFNLQNGALVNFEPMEKIGKFTFPNRNFSNITFKNIKNTLDFQGNKVLIPPMLIETSVFNVFVNGVYSFGTGTNIALEVPLRNPKQDAFVSDSLRETRIRRGIVLNLTAVDGYDGNVRIKLGKRKVNAN